MVRHGQIWFSENGHIIATFLWNYQKKNSKKPSEHFSAYNLSKNLTFLKIKIDHVSWSDHGQLWWSDPEPDDGQTMVNHGRPWSTMVWWSDCRRGMLQRTSWQPFLAIHGQIDGKFSWSIHRVFPRPFTHGMGEETSAWGQSINGGGLIRGDINLMGGPNFDRLYHKLKVVIVKLQLHDAIYQLRFY